MVTKLKLIYMIHFIEVSRVNIYWPHKLVLLKCAIMKRIYLYISFFTVYNIIFEYSEIFII